MKLSRIPFFIFIFLVVTISSCKKQDEKVTFNLGYTYFPTNVGHYIIYNVDSINKDCFTGILTEGHYQIKEVIESVFYDNANRPTLRIERYRKDTVNYPEWTIYNVWTANLTATAAERYENNVRYVKLTFPVKTGKRWNGNVMNTERQEDYEYLETNEPLLINNLSFDSVATVLQADELYSLAEPKFKLEKYAVGVGLIYRKKYVIYLKDNALPGVPDTCGYIDYTERITDYGN